VAEAAAFVRSVAVRTPLAAVAITNYMPDLDPESRTSRAALRLLEQLRV
jgi:hypothetical protein